MVRKLVSRIAVVVGLLLVGLGVASVVRIPYYVEGPGSAPDVFPFIRVSGHEVYPPAGKFLLVSVSFTPAEAIDWLTTWVNPDTKLIPNGAFLAQGESPQQEARRAGADLRASEYAAEYVALSKATAYPARSGPGALIIAVEPGCPAQGKLHDGDVILSVDGSAIHGVEALGKVIDAARPSRSLSFRVRLSDGSAAEIQVAKARCGPDQKELVGISTIDSFPFQVDIRGEIGGPSGGLLFALGLYDLLTPGDLTGGRVIAGTGQIDVEGNVYPIGGIEEKIVAAERAGADAFLVPQQNMAEARRAGADIRLIPVKTFQDALDRLQGS